MPSGLLEPTKGMKAGKYSFVTPFYMEPGKEK